MNIQSWFKAIGGIVCFSASMQTFATVTTIDAGTFTASNDTYSVTGSITNYTDVIEYTFDSSSILSNILVSTTNETNFGFSNLYMTLWKSSDNGLTYYSVTNNTNSGFSGISYSGDNSGTTLYLLTLTAQSINSNSSVSLSNALEQYVSENSGTPFTIDQFGNNSYAVTISGTVAAVPEPETYALMGVGILGLFASHRRRKQQTYKTDLIAT